MRKSGYLTLNFCFIRLDSAAFVKGCCQSFIFIRGDILSDKLGKLLVSFSTGDIVGRYSTGEEEIKRIACLLGDYIDRVFDMYLEFSNMADSGMLLRREYGYKKGAVTAAFYYYAQKSISSQRQQIINHLLNNYLHAAEYPRSGLFVIRDSNGSYKLSRRKCIKKITKPTGESMKGKVIKL